MYNRESNGIQTMPIGQAAPVADHRALSEALRRKFCSPLTVVIALCMTAFCVLAMLELCSSALLPLSETLQDRNILDTNTKIAVGLAMGSCAFVIAAMPLLLLGSWLAVYPTQKRARIAVRLTTIGIQLLSAALVLFAALVFWLLRVAFDSESQISNALEALLTLFIVGFAWVVLVMLLFLSIASAVVFFLISLAYGRLRRALGNPTTVFGIFGMPAAILCYVIAGVCLYIVFVNIGGSGFDISSMSLTLCAAGLCVAIGVFFQKCNKTINDYKRQVIAAGGNGRGIL